MSIVGTAGHVDHGKSTLVLALTERDPDRWEEEKRRGLTIDLGFAWTTLGAEEVGFVDVPGHERFVKNMLAGVGGIDVALFVVAADEGWMPQSEEHLQVLDLLGIERGVVALTRADLVDADTLELVELEVRERIAGTCLADAPIVATSAPSHRGIPELRVALAGALDGAGHRESGRPRLWVDRVFTIGGAGTVATGTLVGGSLEVGDTVAVWPGGRRARVRSLQTHEREVGRALPGSRTAVNLAGIDRTALSRGKMLGRPGEWRPSSLFLADLRTVRTLDEPLRDRGAFHLHAGSGAWPARLRLVEGPVLAGAGAALVETAGPIPLAAGDRLVLREVGRRAVVAGGIVLDPDPLRSRAEAAAATPVLRAAGRDPDDRATALLAVHGRRKVSDLAATSGGGDPRGALVAGDEAFSPEAAASLGRKAAGVLASYHAANPLRPGIPAPALAEALGVDLPALHALAAAGHGEMVIEGAVVRSAGFAGSLTTEAETVLARLQDVLGGAGFAPPRLAELGAPTEVIRALSRAGHLVEVPPDHVYLPDTLDAIVDRVGELADGFTIAELRDALGITRRHAVPLAEWLDASGVTRRSGDRRSVRRLRSDEPGPDAAPTR